MVEPAQESSVRQTLERLNDIVLPEPVSLVPQTVAWSVLGAIIIAGIVAWAMVAWRRYRKNAYRREALELLGTTSPEALPVLVKRVALGSAPRTEVAALTGEPWLTFLDDSYGGNGFSKGPGRALATLSFAQTTPERVMLGELYDLVALWIRRHRV